MALATPSVPMRLVIGFGVLIVAGFTTGWLVFQQDRSTNGWVEHTLVAREKKTTTSVTRVAHIMCTLRETEYLVTTP